VSILSRIAQLHRELAEAYEQLATQNGVDEKPRKRAIAPPDETPSDEAIAKVRRGLRRRGIAA
jgi:hypothetical protein